MDNRTCPAPGCTRRVRCRGMCNTHYERWRLTGDPQFDRPVTDLRKVTVCRVEGCNRDVTNLHGGHCHKHRARKWRTGTTAPRPRATVRAASHGYLLLLAPDHPQAVFPHGWGYQHRIVLWDKIGPGQHPCVYCGQIVVWGVDLHVDHVDDDKTNNDPNNLVPACVSCNSRKALKRRYPRAEPVDQSLDCGSVWDKGTIGLLAEEIRLATEGRGALDRPA